MTLTPEQRDRYSRMLALRDYSEKDMEAVMRTTVSVVGAGGLGSPALRLLTAMGFGHLRIIDRDVVELSNIQRQTVYNTSDIGKPKAEAATANLAAMNPEVELEPISVFLDESNAIELLKGSDIIVDGLDSFHTRHAVNSASLSLDIPYIFAGAIEYHSNLSTFVPGQTGCLQCLAGDAEDDPDYTCANVGVSPELLSIVAGIQVREAVLLATKNEPKLKNRLMVVDVASLTFDLFDIGKDERCPACSVPRVEPSIKAPKGPSVTTLCSGTFSIAPASMTPLDIKEIAARLKDSYSVMKASNWLKIEASEEAEITIMARGNAIVRGVDSEEDALALYREVVGL
ncbi:MAG: ThiF family adenylyltransferase [Candidatus Thorarchaeota archaeon]